MKFNIIFLFLFIIFSFGCSNTVQDFECFWRGGDCEGSSSNSNASQNSAEVTSCTVAGIENSSETAEFTITDGESDSVTCNAGYTKSGSISCSSTVATGTITCAPDSCTISAVADSDATAEFSLAHGATDTISCNGGYTKVGSISCSLGVTSGSVSCMDSNDCLIASGVANSDKTSAFVVKHTEDTEDVASLLTCDSGYSKDGSISCSGGTATGSVSCKQDCSLSGIANSNFTSSGSVPGSNGSGGSGSRTVICDTGYANPAASETFTCDNGTLTGSLSCSIQTYSASIDNLASFGGDTSGSISLNYGDTVAKDDVTCDPGYKSNLTDDGAEVVSDGADGVELSPKLKCSAEEWAIQLHGTSMTSVESRCSDLQYDNETDCVGTWGNSLPFNEYDYTNQFTADKNGNIYAFGSTDNGNDALIIKLDGDGNVIWYKEFNSDFAVNQPYFQSAAGVDRFRAAVVDNNNFTYFTIETTGNFAAGANIANDGVSSSTGTEDCAVGKISEDGEIQWIVQLDDTDAAVNSSSGYDYCGAIDIFESGSNVTVYVGGRTLSELQSGSDPSGTYDGFIAKLSGSDGSIAWVKHIPENGAAVAYCDAIGVDASEDVYCGGYTMSNGVGTNSMTGVSDIFVAKLDTSENTFSYYQKGFATKNSYINSIDLDSLGNVFAVGKTNGNLEGTGDGSEDGFIVKLNSSLSEQWIQQVIHSEYTNDVTSTDSFRNIKIDSTGAPIVFGYTDKGVEDTNSISRKHPLLLKFQSSDGAILWKKQYGDSTDNGPHIKDVVLGDVVQDYGYQLGSSLIINPDGSIYIGSVIQTGGHGFALDSDGNAKSPTQADSDPWIMKVQECVGNLKPGSGTPCAP